MNTYKTQASDTSIEAEKIQFEFAVLIGSCYDLHKMASSLSTESPALSYRGFCYQQREALSIFPNCDRQFTPDTFTTQNPSIQKANPPTIPNQKVSNEAVSKQAFSYIHNRVKLYLWRWAKRRHPNKSKKWVQSRYYSRYKWDNWTFMCQGTDKQGKKVALMTKRILSTCTRRVINRYTQNPS
jgi:hypothetical protein